SQGLVSSVLGLTTLASLMSAQLATPGPASAATSAYSAATANTVKVKLSEWEVQLTPSAVAAGTAGFEVTNSGTIPHAFEVEGPGLEKSTPQIKPGAAATLKLDLRTGRYEAYCPVGKGSHKMLGMLNHLTVGSVKHAAVEKVDHQAGKTYAAGREAAAGDAMAMDHEMTTADDDDGDYAGKSMRVSGGGPVIQILPGPFPFADSAAAVIRSRPADQ